MRMWIRVGLLSVSIAGAVTNLRAADANATYVEGEVLVKFKSDVAEHAATQAVAEHKLQVRRTFRWLGKARNRVYLHLVSTDRTTDELIARLRKDPRVEAVSPNYCKRFHPSAIPNDPRFGEQWGLHNTGQTVNGAPGVPGADIRAPEAWRMQKEGTGTVVVAVLDSGVYYTHPDLSAAMWVNPGENPANNLDDDGNGYTNDVHGYDFAGDWGGPPDPCPMDISGHGTHIAGIIAAAANNNRGVAGVSKARIMALKVGNGNQITDAACIAAIEYATMMKSRGVPIVAMNMSYGILGVTNALEQEAIAEAGNAGIIVCASAGNDSNNNDIYPNYPSSYDCSNIIAVAASDSSDSLASFSNYGVGSVDLAAPGQNILSTLYMNYSVTGGVTVGASEFAAEGVEYGAHTGSISEVAIYCGLGYTNNFWGVVFDRIAIVKRGEITFREKVQNAMKAGAIAVIIFNNESGWIGNASLGVPGEQWIPVVQMTGEDGQNLVDQSPIQVTIRIPAGYGFKDGTSMSTPFVAGAVALAALQFPNENVQERINRILWTTDYRAGLASKVVTGGRLNIANMTDTDNDGIPDWWERMYFSSLADMNAFTDHDGDGSSDRNEFFARTSPTNANSFLRVKSFKLTGPDGVTLTWSSLTSTVYKVERATNLMTPFEPIASDITGKPSTTAYVDSGASNYPALFYRIAVE